ncbi:hypothetical protein LOD99_6424 [Oopsacas minuta]|uniref:3-hydroxyisobutyryl-CoA hydrolase, mitochondrial n=1 Tax=Oopsacas minuta TaxID=111878 RepID=A0AAV7JM03_9METZ|nr:hypothetical protein LOD99_6424 [Oopsacas minuta]
MWVSFKSHGEGLLFETRDSLATITLDRPKALNSLTLDLIRSFKEKLIEWENNPRVKVILVKGGGGKAFCSGGDILFRAQDSKFEDSVKGFGKTFSCNNEPDNTETLQTNLSIYSSLLHQNFDFSPMTEVRPSSAFIAGYAIHGICKSKLYSKKAIYNSTTSLCNICVSLLTYNEPLPGE